MHFTSNLVQIKCKLMLEFDAPKDQSSIIKVIGVGGGGSNAVNHMYKLGIKGVDFILCNTDAQALNASPIPNKIQLGAKGLGAGSKPGVGKESALETIEELKAVLQNNTQMLFVTAGMGGGTGTGAAPVIAAVARELGILTVGIVTLPFSFEGRKRKQQANAGIEELKKYVDTLLIINNDKLRELHGNLKLSEAFGQADDILTIAAKGIAEIITVVGYINVDFEDVKTVMQNSGKAIMGSSIAEGETRASIAAQEVLSSPLLDDNDIKGADDILLYIASGDEEISMDEVTEITDYIQEASGHKAEIIWGTGVDESLGAKISVTLIATGFDKKNKQESIEEVNDSIIKRNLYEEPIAISKPAFDNMENSIPLRNEVAEKVDEVSGPYLKTPKVEEPKAETTIDRTELLDITEPVLIKNEISEPKASIFGDYDKKPVVDNNKLDLEPGLKEVFERSNDSRIEKLKNFSVYKSPSDLEKIENIPAFKRRGINLNDETPSEEDNISRYTLGEGEDNSIELKSNNSYLHKDVD